jgi:hypothetical protein
MTAREGQEELEAQFAQWRHYVQRRRELRPCDADELEDHLRGSVDQLVAAGLSADEAFLVAVKRMGSLDELSREFAREHSERLWKQLVLTGGTDGPAADPRSRRDLWAMVICAAGAAASVKVPELFGMTLEKDASFYGPNLSLFALPWLAAFLAWRRRARRPLIGMLVGLFALGAVAANAYPLADTSQSVVLTSIHLPIAVWLVVGLAYVADDWRSSRRRMDFIRFTGEWVVYYTLIALGGGVLTAFTAGTFTAIGIDPKTFIWQWLLPCGAAAAVVVAGWLVEAKQSVVENIAPVLTRLFTPLFTAVLLAFLVAVGWTSAGINVEREALILFDLLLVVVLGLLLYSISARDPLSPPGLFDKLQLALVVSALAIDALVLFEIAGRITEYGATPNKAAALGVATAEVRPSAHAVRGARALADRLPTGVRRVGLDRCPPLSSVVQLFLTGKVRPDDGSHGGDERQFSVVLEREPVVPGGQPADDGGRLDRCPVLGDGKLPVQPAGTRVDDLDGVVGGEQVQSRSGHQRRRHRRRGQDNLRAPLPGAGAAVPASGSAWGSQSAPAARTGDAANRSKLPAAPNAASLAEQRARTRLLAEITRQQQEAMPPDIDLIDLLPMAAIDITGLPEEQQRHLSYAR